MNWHQYAHVALLSMATVAGSAAAQSSAQSGTVGCARAINGADPVARRVATLNAVTASVRANFEPEVSGRVSVAGKSLDQEISSAITARLGAARVVRESFDQPAGQPGRLCVEVVFPN